MQNQTSQHVQRHSEAHSRPHMHGNKPCSHNHSHSPSSNDSSSSLYFSMLKDSFNTNRVFFWAEVLDGGFTNNVIGKYKALSKLKCLRKNYLQKFASTVLGFATQFLPNLLKPFFAGFFLPLLGFLYVNWKFLTLKVLTEDMATIKYAVYTLFISTVVLFVLVGIVGGGDLGTEQNKAKTQTLITAKPYMNNPRVLCAHCEVIKGFRSQHCPICKQCVPKFSGHSAVFNRCIGAKNQLLYLLFNVSILWSQLALLALFLWYPVEDMHIVSKLVFVLINYYILWMSLVQVAQMLILNLWYNMTQHQIRNWIHQPYLIAYGRRQFLNPLNIGFLNNLRESIYALFGIQEQVRSESALQGSIIEPEQTPGKYITNWAKVMYTNGSELRNHPNRRDIAMKLAEMENMMLLQTQIMGRVRQQLTNDLKGKMSPQEINQRIMMETQFQLQTEMQNRLMSQRNQMKPRHHQIVRKQEPDSKVEESQRLINSHQEQTEAREEQTEVSSANLKPQSEQLLEP